MFVFGTADDVFAMAVRMEENGKAFYSGIASKTEDRKLKQLFGDLATMEEGHIAQFRALRSNLARSFSDLVWDPEGLAQAYLQATADTHVFTVEAAAERLQGIKTPLQALDLALLFEKDSVAFFVGVKVLLPDVGSKGEIDQLIYAEMDHIRMLTVAKKSLAQSGVAEIS